MKYCRRFLHRAKNTFGFVVVEQGDGVPACCLVDLGFQDGEKILVYGTLDVFADGLRFTEVQECFFVVFLPQMNIGGLQVELSLWRERE